MNVLIINLTRFGDLLQTQPVISAFRRQGARIGLCCIENFASASNLLRDVDAVFPLHAARMLAALDSNWRDSVKESVAYRQEIIDNFAPDLVVNLTPSISARLLARNLGAPEVRGFDLDEHGFNADTSSWAAFLQMAGGNRGASPFNVCDLFLRTAGVSGDGRGLRLREPDAALRERMRTLFLSEGLEQPAGFVALQLGASEDRRRWPIARFAELAEMLWQRDRRVPVLLGTEGEKSLGSRFKEKVMCPVVDMQGRTNLEELAATLAECEALVSNDTGTMHLAAGLGVPVVAIFLATAQPWDTGPYHEGSVSLEPDMDCHPCAFGRACANEERCRYGVAPETVYAQLCRLSGGDGPFVSTGARVWQAVFREDGFMTLESCSGHESMDRARWVAMQRWFYRRFLDGESLDGWERTEEWLGADMGGALKKTLGECAEYLFLLQQQGMLLARNPRTALKEKFLASWQQLQNILDENTYLNVLARLWMFEAQQRGNDLDALLGIIERYRTLVMTMLKAL
ncbi:glycosyltransferase family 9 protein [Salidesulfovibrio onnuriiensis]|uniref:glycosyltransferase family 9 protein n=1 Tax=Salidesulfovibrio onnuriiensis TaxID=2583823 RepID=UPI0011CC1156|nr:glycosyltransferase family 9 protein [Salidesulfovibrio onnuriiensis]